MRRSPLAALVVAASLALPLTSGGAAGAQAGTARQKFLDAADAICGTSNARLAKASTAYERHIAVQTSGASAKKRKVAKPADVAQFVREVALAELAGQLRQLRLNVTAPKTDAKAWSELLDAADAAYARLKAHPERAAFQDPMGKVAKDFRDFGFGACGQSAR